MALFQRWLTGERNNHSQVWAERRGGEGQVHAHFHYTIEPVEVPSLGERVLLARRRPLDDRGAARLPELWALQRGDDDQLRLLRYRFTGAGQARAKLRDSASLRTLTPGQLRHRRGCASHWMYDGERFVGTVRPADCRFTSERLGGPVRMHRELQLTEDLLTVKTLIVDKSGRALIGEPGQAPFRYRRVRYFEGWAGVKRQGRDGGEWRIAQGLRLHNEGQRVELVDESGDAMGYAIELARVRYRNSDTPMLKLAVIDRAEDRTITYAWANPGAERIGLHLGWLQVGLTVAEDAAAGAPLSQR